MSRRGGVSADPVRDRGGGATSRCRHSGISVRATLLVADAEITAISVGLNPTSSFFKTTRLPTGASSDRSFHERKSCTDPSTIFSLHSPEVIGV
jgi:hypothetical protein